LEKIGPIRNTHYGGFYDFIPDLSSKDTAYTNEALNPHTDTTYFTEPAGLQAFHLLSHTSAPGSSEKESAGGESILVDGFASALKLKKLNEAHFRLLNSIRVPWHASGNEGVSISPNRNFPVLEGDDSHVFRVRWNNDDRGIMPIVDGLSDWYEAAGQWQSILAAEDNQYRFQLVPGRVLSASRKSNPHYPYFMLTIHCSLRQLARPSWKDRIYRAETYMWSIQ
jgi:trimethyllysine dioxygenase